MTRTVKVLAIAASIAGGVVTLGPAGASADTFNCDATALQATLLTAAPITVSTANAGQPNCQTASGTALSLPPSLGLPLTVNALQAETTLASDGQSATAVGGLGNIGVGIGGSVLSQVTGPIVTAITGSATPTQLSINPISNALLLLLGSRTATLTSADVAGVAPQLQAVLNGVIANALNGNLISTGLLTSTAKATCGTNGSPQLSGSSQLAGLNVLGQNIPLDAPTSQALNLLNTSEISQINLGTTVNTLVNNVIDSLGLTQILAANPLLQPLLADTESLLADQLGPQIQIALTPILTQLQNVLDMVLRLTVQPNNQILSAGQLTQQALHVNLTVNPNGTLGLPTLPLLDLIVGQARVSNASVKCANPAPPSPGTVTSQTALECGKRNLELIDVLQHGRRTFIEGAAKLSLVGQSIPIFFGPSRRQVATAVVQPDGFFRTTAPLPPKAIRDTNEARYFAKAAGQTTMKLKFLRRMIVAHTSVAGGKVTIRGKVMKPLANPVSRIIIQRRVTCTSTVDVGSIAPSANGSFRIVLPSPPNAQVGVYRAKTVVRKTMSNPKRFPTFTLPRFVKL